MTAFKTKLRVVSWAAEKAQKAAINAFFHQAWPAKENLLREFHCGISPRGNREQNAMPKWQRRLTEVATPLYPIEIKGAKKGLQHAHHLAGLADIAELLGKLQQANLGADNLLFS
jgi:hypothetical protein